MAAAPILITDALVSLANAAFTQAVDCYRSYDASTELGDLKKGRVDFVAPTRWTKTLASRSQNDQTCDITVFIRKKFERFDEAHAKQSEVDAWLEFVDELTDAAWAESLGTIANATVTEVDIPTPYDSESLKQNGMFLSVATFTVRWFKSFR